MLKKLQRFNTSKTHFEVNIDIQSINFSRRDALSTTAHLGVVCEKQGKIHASSSYQPTQLSTEGIVVSFGESFKLISTLYKESGGKYMKKNLELQIRHKSDNRSFDLSDKFTLLGKVLLNISDYVESYTSQLHLPIEKNGVSINALLSLVITIAEAGADCVDDDLESVSSSVAGDFNNNRARRHSYQMTKSSKEYDTNAVDLNKIMDLNVLNMHLERANVEKDNILYSLRESVKEVEMLKEQIESYKTKEIVANESTRDLESRCQKLEESYSALSAMHLVHQRERAALQKTVDEHNTSLLRSDSVRLKQENVDLSSALSRTADAPLPMPVGDLVPGSELDGCSASSAGRQVSRYESLIAGLEAAQLQSRIDRAALQRGSPQLLAALDGRLRAVTTALLATAKPLTLIVTETTAASESTETTVALDSTTTLELTEMTAASERPAFGPEDGGAWSLHTTIARLRAELTTAHRAAKSLIQLTDDEREKCRALKMVVMKSADRLEARDSELLFEVGVIL